MTRRFDPRRVLRRVESTPAGYVAVELARERKQPLRRRFELARRGIDLGPLRLRSRSWISEHPFRAMASLVGAPSRSGPVWAVTMVRDEEVRIEGAVRQLLDGGVDVVVVADNLSTDRTASLLADLATELPLVVVSDREPAYYQGPKMSILARAAARCGASWVVPFDADELWYGVGEPLATRLRSIREDAAVAPVFDYLPEQASSASSRPYDDFVWRTAEPVTTKVAFRAHLLASLNSGNHSVAQPVTRCHGALEINHYPFLSFDHFVAKARQGAAALDATDFPDAIGGHWRTWGGAADGELEQHWEEQLHGRAVRDPRPARAYFERSRTRAR